MLVAGACSGGGDPPVAEEPTPVSGDRRGTTTTSTTPIDVSTIPEKIDEPYINAVLAGLDRVNGEVIRLIVEDKQLLPDATEHLISVYDEDELQDQVDLWLRQIQEGLDGFKTAPTPPRTTVARMLSVSPTCMLVEVEEDASGYLVTPGRYTKEFLLLTPLDRSRNRRGVNPTAWMIHEAGLKSDGSDPEDLCAGL